MAGATAPAEGEAGTLLEADGEPDVDGESETGCATVVDDKSVAINESEVKDEADGDGDVDSSSDL